MGGNERVEAIFMDVTTALRDIIKKHNVTWDEYRAATAWLTEAGNQGYEIPLMMDVFLSVTVDNINSPADGGTESNVEGPFYIPEAPRLERPYVLPRRDHEPGDTLVLSGSICSTDGSPLAGALLDVLSMAKSRSPLVANRKSPPLGLLMVTRLRLRPPPSG